MNLPNPNDKKVFRSNGLQIPLDTLTFDILEEITSAQFDFLFFQTSTNLINAMTVSVGVMPLGKGFVIANGKVPIR